MCEQATLVEGSVNFLSEMNKMLDFFGKSTATNYILYSTFYI